MKHLKVLVKWNWWWNFACVSTKSLNFENYFLLFPWEIIFRCYFRQLFMYLALKKFTNDCKILKITLVQNFVHLNLKLLHLLSDFVLNELSLSRRYALLFISDEKMPVNAIKREEPCNMHVNICLLAFEPHISCHICHFNIVTLELNLHSF